MRLREPAAPPGTAPAQKPARRAIAVLGFRDPDGAAETRWIGVGLSEALTEALAGGELRAIPGERVTRGLLELSLESGQDFSVPDLARLERNLAAELFVFGAYRAGPGVELSLRLADRSGATLAQIEERGSEAELQALADRAARRVRAALGTRGGSAGAGGLPADPQAARLYAEGLAQLRAFDALAARERLEKAVAADPRSPLAHAALAAAFSALGYEARAGALARTAFELSAALPAPERLAVEASYRERVGQWERAVEIRRELWALSPDDLEAGLALAAAQNGMGQGKDALDTIAELQRRIPRARDDPRADLEEARARLALGDLRSAQAASARAAQKGEGAGARLLVAQARLAEAEALRRLGALDRALGAFGEARALFTAAGDRGGVARAAAQEATALWYHRDYQPARRVAEEALRLCEAIGDKGGAARALNTLAGLAADQGRLAEARRLYERSLALTIEVGDRDREAVAANNIGIALWKQGDLLTAQRALEQSADLARTIGSRRRECFAVFWLGEVAHDLGQLEAARRRYTEALECGREAHLEALIADAQQGLGKVLFAQGDLAGARSRLEEALLGRRRFEEAYAAEGSLWLAQVALGEGRAAEAESLSARAAQTFQQDRLVHLEALALAIRADALAALRRGSDAQAALSRASTLSRASEYRGVRLAVALRQRRLAAAGGADAGLLALAEEAARFGFRMLELEARLVAAERRRDRSETARLQDEARRSGFGLLAREPVR